MSRHGPHAATTNSRVTDEVPTTRPESASTVFGDASWSQAPRSVIFAIILSTSISVVGGGLWLLNAAPRSAGLVVDKPLIDLGVLPQGSQGEATFNLTNATRQVVHLEDAHSSCGCTVAGFTQDTVGPGECIPLRAVMETGSARGRTIVAIVVTYRLGDSPQPHRRQVRLAATVDPDYSVDPEALHFLGGTVSTREVRVTANRISDLQIRDAYATRNAYDVRTERVAPGEWHVTVQHTPEGQPPQSRGELHIMTNSPNEELFIVPLFLDESDQ